MIGPWILYRDMIGSWILYRDMIGPWILYLDTKNLVPGYYIVI